ncbi:MAG: Uncharacterised protein [Owenweeksia sp. TMED14]|nr:MAG: Uncharacterised protein [Owenweeksia sp. TMED14]
MNKFSLALILFVSFSCINAQTVVASASKSSSRNLQDAYVELDGSYLENPGIDESTRIYELHTRPISLLQGVITIGFETKIVSNTSLLFDIGAGSSLFDESELVTGMIGVRYYLGAEADQISGNFLSFRHRSRWYSVPPAGGPSLGSGEGLYGANTNFMFGRKIVSQKLSAAAEIGVGRQTVSGITLLLPTWAVTLGFRF